MIACGEVVRSVLHECERCQATGMLRGGQYGGIAACEAAQ